MEHTKNETIIHDTDKESSWEQQPAMKESGISILVNLLLSIFKLIAGIAAHSGAMISDAIHSASDVGSTFIVIIGVRLSAKKSDKEHQYDLSVYALDCKLNLKPGFYLNELIHGLRGHVLSHTRLSAMYRAK